MKSKGISQEELATMLKIALAQMQVGGADSGGGCRNTYKKRLRQLSLQQ